MCICMADLIRAVCRYAHSPTSCNIFLRTVREAFARSVFATNFWLGGNLVLIITVWLVRNLNLW